MKKITMISIIAIALIFTGTNINNNFTITEEQAKTPIYVMGDLAALGNLGGEFIETATNITDKFFKDRKEFDEDRAFAVKWLNNYKTEATTMTKKEFIEFIKEKWENLPWYKKIFNGTATQPGYMTAGMYWNTQNEE